MYMYKDMDICCLTHFSPAIGVFSFLNGLIAIYQLEEIRTSNFGAKVYTKLAHAVNAQKLRLNSSFCEHSGAPRSDKVPMFQWGQQASIRRINLKPAHPVRPFKVVSM